MLRFFSQWRVRHYLAAFTALAVSFVLGSLAALAASPQAPTKADAPPQGMFAAIEAGDLEVGVVPRDARRLTIQLKNKTERPLTIQMPPAFAAAPVLAQQPFGPFPGFPANQPNQNNRRQSPQQLGIGQPGGNNGNLFGQGLFHIPAGRAIKLKADCVCLEYGKPEPDARMKYEVKSLAEVSDNPELAAVLHSLGKEQIDQRAAQAAAWHLTADLSWDQLAGLLRREVGAYKELQFTTAEIAAAKKYLDQLSKSERPANQKQSVTSLQARSRP